MVTSLSSKEHIQPQRSPSTRHQIMLANKYIQSSRTAQKSRQSHTLSQASFITTEPNSNRVRNFTLRLFSNEPKDTQSSRKQKARDRLLNAFYRLWINAPNHRDLCSIFILRWEDSLFTRIRTERTWPFAFNRPSNRNNERDVVCATILQCASRGTMTR